MRRDTTAKRAATRGALAGKGRSAAAARGAKHGASGASRLIVIGLYDDVLLPGEVRVIAHSDTEAAALKRVARAAPARVCVVPVALASEIPQLLQGRWGTECDVLLTRDDVLVVRGARRVRIERASEGGAGPYVEVSEGSREAEGGQSQIRGVHAVMRALDAAYADAEGAAASKVRLDAVVAAVLREVGDHEGRLEGLRGAEGDVLQRLARTITGEQRAAAAESELDALLAEVETSPSLPRLARERLWARLVEIQKRLDLYDPVVDDEGGELAQLQRRLSQAGLPRAGREVAKRELRLLRAMATNHHDYTTYLAHLDFMARLPWHSDPTPPVDLDVVRRALDATHHGLLKGKQRVLEHLAVSALGGTEASMVLCLVGPPGVGKTSLARAVATALGRPFVRVALGGVHDECEIRGHRISFTAASAGRILQGLARVRSRAAVVLLDEIDKVGTDRQRSPAAALLEVLDPEQNTHFHDHYLGVPYDLSKVLFIATANHTANIDETLLDRLEIVDVEGYSATEKGAIVHEHLLPRLRAEHGLSGMLSVRDDALSLVLEGYTREAGIRQLRRALAAVHRKRALSTVCGMAPTSTEITPDEVARTLGPRRYPRRSLPDRLPPGVAIGLSVGPDGGAILPIEVARVPGEGELFTTGRIGEIMREAARTALAHLRMDPFRYGVDPASLACDIHVHAPEAASAKDGPSAGITLFFAMLSAVSGVPLCADVAFTGEITLNGRILPVGGLRAKLLGAERAGVRRVIVPEENQGDVPEGIGVDVIAAGAVADVVQVAFARPFVARPTGPIVATALPGRGKAHAHSDASHGR